MAIQISGTTVIDNSRNLSNITNASTSSSANTYVVRDASGNFGAGTISAALNGNASTATALAISRSIALEGDVTGSANFDGSANVTITAAVADDSHNHIISNVDGLQTALDAKAPLASPTFTGTSTFSSGGVVDVLTTYRSNVTALGGSDINCSLGNYFTVTVGGNTTFTFSNAPASRSYGFVLEVQLNSGALTFPGSVQWPKGTPPTLSTGKTHLLIFITDDGGSRWRGSSLVDYTN